MSTDLLNSNGGFDSIEDNSSWKVSLSGFALNVNATFKRALNEGDKIFSPFKFLFIFFYNKYNLSNI